MTFAAEAVTPLRYPNLSHPKWTPEQVERLRELWDRGLSASEISRDLRAFTRNAVIGKVHRLELPARPRLVNQFGYGSRKKDANPPARPRKYKYFCDYIATKKRPPAPEVIDQQIPLEQRKSLMELGPHDCRWSVGDVGEPGFFFCGGMTEDNRAYCPGHWARGHQCR